MLQYQKKFGLIRRKKPICTPSAVSVRPLRLLRSLGLSCLFLTFSSFFSAPRWEENGGRELLRGLAPPGVAGPWERAPQETLAGISKPQSSGPGAFPLAGQHPRGAGVSALGRGSILTLGPEGCFLGRGQPARECVDGGPTLFLEMGL